ncbi:hypothetical protein SBOR_3745 [Sclerotinia borealis F-4128]|uniref:Apple domain-containing protein n=1 Tax=Sclerotinia borealis (strain F-4128) TaxID=1432307 RepID=W9CJ37_SCLBF|nr:hypothetical protein SBOR_3745 [Sclerotinia borealis F-4128]
MQLLTVVGAIAVLSNVVSAIPQPNEKVENIQEKRWNWPWESHSGKGGHEWGDDDDDDYDDDDNAASSSQSLLPFTHPHLRAEDRSMSSGISRISMTTLLSTSSSSLIDVSTATDLWNSLSTSLGLANSVSVTISTVTYPILSATSVVINTSPTSTSTALGLSISGAPFSQPSIINNISDPASLSLPLSLSTTTSTLINILPPPQSTPLTLTLCPANPTSIVTITENCTRTEWITVIASEAWTTTPLSTFSPTTTMPTPSSSISGVPPSGFPSSNNANSTGLWTATPSTSVSTSASASRGWTTSVQYNTSSSLAVGTGTGVLGSVSISIFSSSSSTFVSSSSTATDSLTYSSSSVSSTLTFESSSSSSSSSSSFSSTSSSIPASSSSSSSSSSTSTQESTSTTLLFSTTTLPYSSPTLSSSPPPSSSSTTSSSPLISATPISTGTTDLHPSTTVLFTTTVTTIQVSGTPNPAAVHCGLHGLPVGDYFLAEFVEDKSGVPVSLRGCWEFCRGVYGIDKGCVAYSYYPEPGTGAPRCDLFGGSVAQSLDSIIPQVPNVWFDLECGHPRLIVV